MRKLILALALFGLAVPAHAADLGAMPVKASAYSGYPAASGFYFGVNSALGTGKANGVVSTTAAANAGTLTTQMGEVGATIGYTWALAGQPVWWAVEGTFDFSNINSGNPGLVNGGSLSLGGPADLGQIVILGAPWGAVASLLPNFNFTFRHYRRCRPDLERVRAISTRSWVPIEGVSANFGQAAAKTWLIGIQAGVGTRFLLTNSTALDIQFEYRTPSQSECVSSFQVVSGCAGMGSSYWARTAVLF